MFIKLPYKIGILTMPVKLDFISLYARLATLRVISSAMT